MGSQLTAYKRGLYEAINQCLLRNFSEEEIQESLARRGYELTLSTVHNYIGNVRSEIAKKRVSKPGELVDAELEQLYNIRRLALDGYARSLETSVVTETTVKSNIPSALPAHLANLATQSTPEVERTERVKSIPQAGDPRFLAAATAASNEIRKLLGIDPAEVKRLEFSATTDAFDISKVRDMDSDDIKRMLDEEIRKVEGSQ